MAGNTLALFGCSPKEGLREIEDFIVFKRVL